LTTKIGTGQNPVGDSVENLPGSQPSFGIYIFKLPDSPKILKLRVERYGAEGDDKESQEILHGEFLSLARRSEQAREP